MKRPTAVLLTIAALSGCSDRGPPAAAYRSWKDRMVGRLGLKPLVQPCVREDRLLPTGECYEMLPAHRWRGVWEDHLEGQVFCPGAATQCPAGGSGFWLDYASAKRPAGWTPGGVYAIDFIGRRTKFEGGYAHMGASRHAMVVDRMNSMKQLQAPPEK